MIKLEKTIYYYLGKDGVGNYIATPCSNMIISGHEDNILRCLKHTLIKLIQDVNPNEIVITIVDAMKEFKAWKDAIPGDKLFPYVDEIVCDSSNKEFTNRFLNILNEVKITIQNRMECDALEKEPFCFLVVNDYRTIFNKLDSKEQKLMMESLEYIICNSEMVGMYLILTENGTFYEDELLRYTRMCTTKVVTSMSSDETSQIYLGNICASKDRGKSGIIWFKRSLDTPIRLTVPFMPDSWIKKFVGVFSVCNKED